MKLHLDKESFRLIIDSVSIKNNVRKDILEKDYYVTLLLRELSIKKNQGYAYFKGGTALYKALKSIRRFSEDIDLTVKIDDCPNQSQSQKRLKEATLKYSFLKKGDVAVNKKGSITCEYLYDSLFVLDVSDELQRFGKVMIEATSFTISEPIRKIVIAPYLYELANDQQKQILERTYDVFPFEIETISLERIFIDKVFAIQFYFERKEFNDVAKHAYDITILLNNECIKTFLNNKDKLSKIIEYKRKEEKNRIGGVSQDLKIYSFDYFTKLSLCDEFSNAFEKMQKIYVFNEDDKLVLNDVINALSKLHYLLKDF